ncbi:MarR family winged helix-turn-helix transcriptional regulator [Chitinophaga vietnamensis]|uniref:MarR family winged helix-turn-helix transcriptional regulator n=1 Tax=Chitinophaga vietnamensis TaxID=2593957 RepID=UPI001177A8C1|nr:MarR family transcriptional regulator [Chitinophaga vietnamensis]
MKKEEKIFSVDNADESSGFLLWQVTSLWQRGIRKALEKYDITHSQFVLLASAFWLSTQDQPVTQVLLSSHSKIDPMTTSTVLRNLQSKGLLKRKEHATDTRAKTVALTEEGKALVKQAVKTVEQFDKEFFSVLGDKTGAFNKKLQSLLSWKE